MASASQLPGCHSQARSPDEVPISIREAIELGLEVKGTPACDLEYEGIQQITVAAAA